MKKAAAELIRIGGRGRRNRREEGEKVGKKRVEHNVAHCRITSGA